MLERRFLADVERSLELPAPRADVDALADLTALPFADGAVGTAICLDGLTRCADPIAAGRELARVVRPGGVCVAAAPMLRPVRGSGDLFRLTPAGLRAVLDGFDEVAVAAVGDPGHPLWVFGLAARGRALHVDPAELSALAAAQRHHVAATCRYAVGPLRFAGHGVASAAARELPRAVRDRVRAWHNR